jgi:hypothetical protein
LGLGVLKTVDIVGNMKRLENKRIVALAAIAALTVLPWAWSVSAPIRGNVAARIDLHRGRYQLLGYGLPSLSRPEYESCLCQRYNVSFRPVAGCIVSESLVSYVDAYDSEVVEATNRRLGHNVFKECDEEATENWKEQVKARRAHGQ